MVAASLQRQNQIAGALLDSVVDHCESVRCTWESKSSDSGSNIKKELTICVIIVTILCFVMPCILRLFIAKKVTILFKKVTLGMGLVMCEGMVCIHEP